MPATTSHTSRSPRRMQAIGAIRQAGDATHMAYLRLMDADLHPNLAADYVRDVQRWAGHALAHLQAEAEQQKAEGR